MRRLFTLLFLLVSATSFAQFTRDKEPPIPRYTQSDTLAQQTATKVYVCDSKTAKAYHSDSGCRGLNRCTHGVIAVTKEEAEGDYSRVKCQICW